MTRHVLPILGAPVGLTALSARMRPDRRALPHCHPTGVLECRACRRQAGLLVGTVMERSQYAAQRLVLGRVPRRQPDAGMSAVQFSAATLG